MNKENKKMAQERKAQERAKEESKKKAKSFLSNWGPVILIVAVVIVMLVAIITSGAGGGDSVGDTEDGFSFVDENGNELEVSDWTEVDEDEDAEETDGAQDLDTTEGRVVENGDTVNIDYVGSVDGVEFDGGNTQGMGADLTIGSGMYIDGFEDAIIGHSVGETFDLTVTFPDPYENDETLSGKEAVFKTTINGIYK